MDLCDDVNLLVYITITQSHPDWSEDTVKSELAQNPFTIQTPSAEQYDRVKDALHTKLEEAEDQPSPTAVKDKVRSRLISKLIDEIHKCDTKIVALSTAKSKAQTPVPKATPTPPISGRQLRRQELKQKRLQNIMMNMIDNISNHRSGTPFSHPVNPKEAPDYASLVRLPQDLRTIKTQIKDGVIFTFEQFHREVLRVFANSEMYNGSDKTSALSIWGKECFKYTEELFDLYYQAENET
ncbi:bromodomain containing protein 1 [Schizosaccharomyces japonicus yFS275]|uniref:Bromodomain containing protein 1 n=1 Tax=Schizosaccharomyces japonicus (strain yFS275 / FY16936) TaxID=402676 RepID=B6JXP6_SCHJY|nr:bromodomain containing protein 1 [Schizosaccharomyces japonicus yFS275]EEB05190.1 bromodomain containing protein 1 [Schizosaccharomyces japonicus yFS275]